MLMTDKKALKNYNSSKRIWQGIPSIEVTKKGRIFVTFYSGGTAEEIGNYVILLKSDDGIEYGEPIAVCYEDGHRCFDPCLWIDPLGRLWLTWSRCPDDGVYGAICDNPDADEIIFGKEFFIGNNVMMNKPTVLSTGEWAFPIAVWNDGVRVLSAEYDSKIYPKGSFMYISSDRGKTFKKSGYADIKERSFDEHIFLEMSSGCIRVFVRTKYGIGAADSYDGGQNWGEGFDTKLGGPCSRFFIKRLDSGRILLINHYNYTGRNNLTAMLSDDNGKTFPHRLLIDERENVSYPDAAVAPDGSIYITYDRERGAFEKSLEDAYKCAREILIAHITEEEIINGKLFNENSYLKRVCSKLSVYDGDKDIYDEKFVSKVNQMKNINDIISAIFDAYNINCINIHNVDAEMLDNLLEQYKKNRSMNKLTQIISLIKRASYQSNTFDKEIVDKICFYINNNIDKNEEIREIAEKFNYSYNYIQHIFKKHTGINIHAYRMAQRLTESKILLKGCDNKIADIAAECGFESSSYFTEVFKRETGITPLEYRKNIE